MRHIHAPRMDSFASQTPFRFGLPTPCGEQVSPARPRRRPNRKSGGTATTRQLDSPITLSKPSLELDAQLAALTAATQQLTFEPRTQPTVEHGANILGLPVEIIAQIAEWAAYDLVIGWDVKSLRPFALSCSYVFGAIRGLAQVLVVDNRLKVPRALPAVESMAQVRRMRVTMTRPDTLGNLSDHLALCAKFIVHLDLLNITQQFLEEALPRMHVMSSLRHLNVSSRRVDRGTTGFSRVTAATMVTLLKKSPYLERLAYDNIDESNFCVPADQADRVTLLSLVAQFGPLSQHLAGSSRHTLERIRFTGYMSFKNVLPIMPALQQLTFDGGFSRSAYVDGVLMKAPALKHLDITCVSLQMPTFVNFPFTLDELHLRWLHVELDGGRYIRLMNELDSKPLKSLQKLRLLSRGGISQCPPQLAARCKEQGIQFEVSGNAG